MQHNCISHTHILLFQSVKNSQRILATFPVEVLRIILETLPKSEVISEMDFRALSLIETIQKPRRSQTNEMISRANSTGFYALLGFCAPPGFYALPGFYAPPSFYTIPGFYTPFGLYTLPCIGSLVPDHQSLTSSIISYYYYCHPIFWNRRSTAQ